MNLSNTCNSALVTIAIVFMLIPKTALSQSSWFLEMSAGQSSLSSNSIQTFDVARHYPPSTGLAPVFGSVNTLALDDSRSYSLSIGRKISDYLSIDLAYMKFDTFEKFSPSVEATIPTQLYSIDTKFDVEGFNLSLSGSLPLGSQINLYADASFGKFDSTQESIATLVEDGGLIPGSRLFFIAFGGAEDHLTRGFPKTLESDGDETKFNYAVGIAYNFIPSTEVKLEYRMMPDIGAFDIELLSVAVAHHF